MKQEKIIVFDTTLRDGEQSPGASLNIREKLDIALQLARLGVDVIEAGFPISSPGDFESVKLIAQKVGSKNVKPPQICGLARAVKKDIETCWQAVKYAKFPRIHTFIATSDIHIKQKFNKTRPEILDMAIAAVRYAKKFTDNVEFSPEDAVRSDPEFLCQVVEATIDAGATTINIPDTVGYALPWQFGELIQTLFHRVKNIHQTVISVHCHNDLGLAVANSLTAINSGARQVECTINGIGERAGNAALEEIVMSLYVHRDLVPVSTGINTTEIYRTSRMVSRLTGLVVQPNKAVVGDNAFAHEAGIHQDGMLKSRLTYEIMDYKTVGVPESTLVLGKHSGRHAFDQRLRDLGVTLSPQSLEKVFLQFKELADKKKYITNEDLLALVEEEVVQVPEYLKLEYLHTSSGSGTIPTATVKIRKKDKILQEAACGDGPVDATYRAIDRIARLAPKLIDYTLRAVTGGKDALGEVIVKIELNKSRVVGSGRSTDIIEASARAYLNAINKYIAANNKPKPDKIAGRL